MCTYSRTIFKCLHQIWLRRLKLCSIGEDYQAGLLPHDCAMRKPHGLQSRKLCRKCDKCLELDRKRLLLTTKMEEFRIACRERWPRFQEPMVQSVDEEGENMSFKSEDEDASQDDEKKGMVSLKGDDLSAVEGVTLERPEAQMRKKPPVQAEGMLLEVIIEDQAL